MTSRQIEGAFKRAQQQQAERTAPGSSGEAGPSSLSVMSFSKSHIDRLFKAQADPAPPWPFTLQFLKITSHAAGITQEEHKKRCVKGRALIQAMVEGAASQPARLPAARTATTGQHEDGNVIAVLQLERDLERARHTETHLRYALRDHDVLQSTLLQIIGTLREIIAGNDAREAQALANAHPDEAARLRDETHRALGHRATAQQEADRTAARMRILEDLWTRARAEAQRLVLNPRAVNLALPTLGPDLTPQPLLATELLAQPVLDDIAAALDKAHAVSVREEEAVQALQRLLVPGDGPLQPDDEVAVLLASTRLPDPKFRMSALVTLSATWRHVSAAKEAMLRLVADPDTGVRRAAVEALAEGWPGDAEARRAVLSAVADPDTGVRWAAVEALAEGWPGDAEARRAVLSAVADPDTGVRWAAVEALAKGWPENQS